MGSNLGCCPTPIDCDNFKNYCLQRASPEYKDYLSKIIESKTLYHEDLIIGDWKDDNSRTGKGIIYSPQQFYFEGDIINSKAEGYGRIIWPNRASYIGNIMNNQANGEGELIFDEGDFSLKGQWKYGQPLRNSKMQMTRKEQKSSVTIIEMSSADSNLKKTSAQTLVAKIQFGQGVIYEGETQQKKDCVFKFQGKGKLTFNDGSKYEGQFVNGKMHGKGHYYWSSNNHWYEGQYKNNLRDGIGTYYYSKLVYKKGIWRDGILCQQIKQ